MADIVKQRAATPKVALPKFPPGKAANWGAKPKGTSTPPSSGQQTPRSEEQPKPKPQQPVDLTALQVDARVQVTNTLSKTFLGTVYSCDTDLILSTGPADYHIIPVSKITKVEVLPEENNSPKQSSNGAVKPEERKASPKFEPPPKPPGVSAFGYKLFLALNKTLPVRWQDKSIVVMDTITIDAPYGANDCKAPAKSAKQLERVRELVRKVQEKEKPLKDSTFERRGG